jgi:hypothetical protein
MKLFLCNAASSRRCHRFVAIRIVSTNSHHLVRPAISRGYTYCTTYPTYCLTCNFVCLKTEPCVWTPNIFHADIRLLNSFHSYE